VKGKPIKDNGDRFVWIFLFSTAVQRVNEATHLRLPQLFWMG